MKKTLVSAITTALVIGAASTTFAAANPFSDVPRDSWAYDAVTKLAKDGVINGYGDGTFRGDTNITRYEMAQMVAKAMAKDGVSAADKATIDKLAAEFADELNTLGVRVSNLEKKVDNVKFTGEARYRYTSTRHSDTANYDSRTNTNKFLFRLEPSAQINDNWTAKARFDWESDLDADSNAGLTTDRVYVQGKLFGADAKLGKLPTFSAQGVVIDDRVSGAEFTFGNKVKTTLTAGRFSPDNAANWNTATATVGTGTYVAAQFDYPAASKLNLTAGYQQFTNKTDLNNVAGVDKLGMWNVGFDYKFSNTLGMNALYVKETKGDMDNKYKKAYNVQLNYKGADAAKKGTFGVYAAYRYLGQAAVLDPTFDGVGAGQKGYEVGTSYTFDKNIVGTALYFKGKDLATNDTDASKVFGQVEFFF